ncbi:MAG: hypothetical protein FWE69_00295 [Clostridiales bacterium]|nr:hypothetical protein [Clostridiales bacterium]
MMNNPLAPMANDEHKKCRRKAGLSFAIHHLSFFIAACDGVFLARPEGFEPPTFRSSARQSQRMKRK